MGSMTFYLQNFVLANTLLCVLLSIGMTGLTWLGWKIGRRWFGGEAAAGWATLEAAMLGLFALMLAFTFSGAADRFQNRRELIVEQAKVIETAYARLDMLDETERLPLQQLFREYMDLLLADHSNIKDFGTLDALVNALEAKGKEIWKLSAAACRQERYQYLVEIVPPAVNDMLAVGLARRGSFRHHLPAAITGLLFVLALSSALLVGFGTAPSPRMIWIHAATFAIFCAMTIFVILDLEYPRLGLLRITAADEILRAVRRGM
jgi:hypothetical protein